MNLDSIINKYGMHELDIDFCQRRNGTTIVYAYCHEHDVGGEFMINHHLEIKGDISAAKMEVENNNDICIHLASIEKLDRKFYEISGVGGWIQFSVNGELLVKELTEEEYTCRLNMEEANMAEKLR